MGKTRKLVVADESITVQKLVHLTFANSDYDVVIASDGYDALTKTKALKPDLLLADLHLRQMDGATLCSTVRLDSSLTRVKVILLRPIDKKEAPGAIEVEDCRADEILNKPFEGKVLYELVNRLMHEDESTLVKPKPGVVPAPAVIHTPVPAASAPVSTPAPVSAPKDLTSKLSAIAAEVVGGALDGGAAGALDENTAEVAPVDFEHPVKLETAKKKLKSPFSQGASTESSSELSSELAESVIREWVEKNLPAIAERIVKEEISKLAGSTSFS